jgi:hypothetical protein
MSLNTEFAKTMLMISKRDLVEKLGKKIASQLINKHMDVCGHNGSYFCHWVKYPEVGLNEDLYKENRASCMDEARAIAIGDLIDYLFPSE